MPAFPLSLRLLAVPLWGAAWGRARLAERGRPVVLVRVDARHPLPPAHVLGRLADAPAVRAVHIVIDELAAGWATLAAAREALRRVRAAGKLVFVELERCGNGELYLASVADRVWLRPMADVHALGVAAVLRFAGDALARFGLEFDVEAAGAFKSFGEMWTRAYGSAANREATKLIVDDLQRELEEGIAEGRGLAVEVVRSALAEGPLAAEDARARGLIDDVGYADAARSALEALLGGPFRVVPFARWAAVTGVRDWLEGWIECRRRVVVLHLHGPVVDGEGPPGSPAIAAGPVGRALDALREDESVAAVVLSIRSPGGSAVASDRIWRDVERLVRAKPVIAAFDDVAASGGYYVAAGATEIWALPNTLTGSIGVVGGKLVVAPGLARLGVYSETIPGAPHASMFRAEAPFSPSERERFRASLDRFYRTFVDRVAAGRKQPWAAVEAHAQGRVWTGRQAHERGLVDHLGDTTAAVARAAGLSSARNPVRIDIRISPRSTRLARLVRRWMESAAPELGLIPALPATARALMEAAGRPLYLLPWEIDIR